MTTSTLPQSKHFELSRITEGVYAAVGLTDGAALSNAGIVDLGDRTLVFDTLGTPAAAQDLKSAAEQLTGRVPCYVVNSHAHYDHWCGNQVFDQEAMIIASRKTWEQIVALEPELRSTIADPAPLADQLSACRKRLEKETDPRWRATLERAIPRLQQQLDGLQQLEPVAPNVSFDLEMSLHGSKRNVFLRSYEGAHSQSDSYLIVPQDGVIFTGDLGFFGAQPLIVFGDLNQWISLLKQWQNHKPEIFVPGHGPVGGKDDIGQQKDYFTAVRELVSRVIDEGGTVDSALQQQLGEPFASWVASDMSVFERNVRATFDLLTADSEVPHASC